MSKPLVLCIGNRLRQDDGIGPAIAEVLNARLGNRADIMESWGEGTELMAAWEGRDMVIAVDAARSNTAKPGTLHCFDAARVEIPRSFFHYSTHRFALAEAVELSHSLHSLPRQLIVIAIEGENFNLGEGLSESVVDGVTNAIEKIEELVP